MLGRTCFYMNEYVPLTRRVLRCRSCLILSVNPTAVTGLSFDDYILFDRGTHLPGKVSVTRTISLPSITSRVCSIKCHAGMAGGQRSHAALQALKNKQHALATPRTSSSINCLLTLGHWWMWRQAADAPSAGDVPAVVLGTLMT